MPNVMEFSWERRNKIYPVNKDLVQRLFYPLTFQKKISTITYLSGGLSNTNYLVTFKAYEAPFVLRIYTGEEENYEKELGIYESLKNDIPLPKIHYTSNTKDIIDKPFSIQEYLEGETLANLIGHGQRPNENVMREIGVLLGAIHNHRFEKAGFIDKHLKIKEELGRVDQWLAKYVLEPVNTGNAQGKLPIKLSIKLNRLIEKEGTILVGDPPLVLTHGDFKPTNIMISQGEITGILDWEFACAGPYYFDLGQMLRYEEDMPNDFELHLINGYRQNIDYEISENWKKMAKLIDLINLIGFLTDGDGRPEMQKKVVSLIDKTINIYG